MPRKAAAKSLPLPPGWLLHEVAAVQALGRGEADADQQKLALDFVILKLANTYGDTFDPDSRVSAFNDGKRKVGQELVMSLKLNLAKFGGSEHG